MAEVIRSQKGKNILTKNGYLYHFHSRSRNREKLYWRCAERLACSAWCVTNADLENIILFKDGEGQHLHVPNPVDVEVKKITERMKERAAVHPYEAPLRVIRETTTGVNNEEILARLPDRNHLRRTVNKEQNRTRPRNVNSVAELEIILPYTQTIREERFLLFDSGRNDPDRFIIFASNRNLENLCASPCLCADGTFMTVPLMFMQLFTIHGFIHEHLFPLVFCLMKRRTEENYFRVLEQIISKVNEQERELRPTTFIVDFELASINAIQRQFPNANVKGCLYHFSQSIYRKINSLGLREAYLRVQEPAMRYQMQELMALPFIPLVDVELTFEFLYDNIDETLIELADYMDHVYIRGRRARGRRRAVQPRYPPPVWNMYETTLQGNHRTNNAVEGFHSKLQKIVSAHHVTIWRFLDNIRAEQNETENTIFQIEAGHGNIRQPINQRYKTNQRRIERIVRQYENYKDNDNVKQYLRAISYHLKTHNELPEGNAEDVE